MSPNASLLQLNDPAACLAACGLLKKVLEKIIENPAEPKYRRIRKSAGAFADTVWKVVGGQEFLRSVGFQDQGEFVALPEGVPKERLTDAVTALFLEERVATRKAEEQWLDRMEQQQQRVRAQHDVPKRPLEDLPPEARAFLDPKTLALSAVRLFKDVFVNILHNPDVAKFRRVNTTSSRFQTAAADVPGARAFLAAAGFQEARPDAADSSAEPTLLVFPDDGDLALLQGTLLLLEEAESEAGAQQFAAQREVLALSREKRAKQAAEPQRIDSTPEGREQWQRENEEHLTASQLISEISAAMELVWLLEGASGTVAHFRKEQKRLLQHFKDTKDFAALHRMKDEWNVKLERTKLRTGGSLVDTIPVARPVGKSSIEDEPPKGAPDGQA